MLTNTSLSKLDSVLIKFYEKELRIKCESLRTKILNNPTQDDGIEILFDTTDFRKQRHMKLKEKTLLGIFSWYFPEEIRWLIQFWLEENWGGESKEIRDVILTSKTTALGYLIIQKEFNNHDFYGNILKNTTLRIFLSPQFDFVKNNWRQRVKRYSGYCRGYQDNNRKDLHTYSIVPPEILNHTEQLWKEAIHDNKVIDLLSRINCFVETEQVS